ncbi:hypothetical protein WICPIJ_004122 [Wickerhamomyces pijperi]|uniref:Ubiquitin-activating enzyme E1-like n=1 Tax=Wickerhamomyces pijperi TaxID=599730 RepID=A0A9P8Q690_WICPI|nr:hypothetical protein WICPIJ_004122 [Wickerhamomyces pijperi]
MTKDHNLKVILGEEKYNQIHNSKVLLVGAGGIGCELLKDLVLLGFGEIHVVDLDTIDLSNLNRQFLFRHKDIKQPKSTTAIKAVSGFNFHNSKLVPYQNSIYETDVFPLTWFDSFDLIFNALDNAEARSYINKIGLFLNKTILETGTTGTKGYVQATIPGQSACYDCTFRETPKTFPVCTIRSTPSQPVHCVHWAKNFLFSSLFGEDDDSVEDNSLEGKDASELGTDNQEELQALMKESNELIELKRSIVDESFEDKVIEKIFVKDIENLLKIEELWQQRTKPTPINYTPEYKAEILKITKEQLGTGQKLWTLEQNLSVLISSIRNLQARYSATTPIEFDKDDEDTLDFVVASTNIRSHIFNIPLKSKFDIKSIAGNIIPAVATTNAFIAGFSSLLSLGIFNNPDAFKDTRAIFASEAKDRFLSSGELDHPNPKCSACSVTRGVANIDLSLTFRQLIDALVEKYGYDEEIALSVGSKILYDLDLDDNVEKSFTELKVKYGDHLEILDETDVKGTVELYIETNTDGKITLPELVIPDKPKPVEEKKSEEDEDDDDDLEVFEENDEDELLIVEEKSIVSSVGGKRKLEDAEDNEPKKVKV